MKKIIFVLLTSVSIIFVGCKTTQQDPQKVAAKEEKTAMQKAQDMAAFNLAVQTIDDLDFVLEANKITFLSGQPIYVNSSTNFISVNKEKGTVQLSFNTPNPGYNGIGGITIDGSISNVKKDVDKKGNISFTMSILGSGVSADIFFKMYNGSTECSATVSPNMNRQRITFTGTLYPTSESNVFKGTSLF